MMLGQIAEQNKELDVARDAFARGLKSNPTSTTLWILAANLEQKAGECVSIVPCLNIDHRNCCRYDYQSTCYIGKGAPKESRQR